MYILIEKDIIILYLPTLSTIKIGVEVFYETTSLTFESMFLLFTVSCIDLPNLSTFTTDKKSFKQATSLTLSSIFIFMKII